MTKKFSLEDAQLEVDRVYPGMFKLLTYTSYKEKCNFIWLSCQEPDSIQYYKFFHNSRKKHQFRLPPSSRNTRVDKYKHTLEYRKQMIRDRSSGEAELVHWDADTYKVTIKWSDGEINTINWRRVIDRRATRLYPLSSKRARIAQTNISRYGSTAPAASAEIGLRIAKSSNRSFVLYHWRDNKELICQGSYEYKVAIFLNTHKINFQWQPKVFVLPSGKTYRPDLFLEDNNLWVEIKGYFRDDAKIKWAEFQSICPNSILWDKKYLKDNKII